MDTLTLVLIVFAILSFIFSFCYILIQWIARRHRHIIGWTVIYIASVSFIIIGLLTIVNPFPYLASHSPPPTIKPASTSTSQATAIATPTGYEPISSQELSGLEMLMYSSSGTFTEQQTSTITVDITPLLSAPEATSTPRTPLSTDLTPVGTPGATITNAFGPNYSAYIVAELHGSAFDIDPAQQTQQSLNQGEIVFTWTITPKYVGNQLIYTEVTGIWTPKNGGPSIQLPLGSTQENIIVNTFVNSATGSSADNGSTLSSITLNVFVGLIGSAFNIPWIWDLISKRRKKKQPTSDQAAELPLVAGKQPEEPPAAPPTPKHESDTSSKKQEPKKHDDNR